MDLRQFVLINTYVPAFGETSARHLFKQAFHIALHEVVQHLHARGSSVVLVGDINATAGALDRCDEPSTKRSNNDRTAQPLSACGIPPGWFRCWFGMLLAQTAQAASDTAHPCAGAGQLLDAFRVKQGAVQKAFTCWSTLTAARKTNYGRRLDYTLISSKLQHALIDSNIQADVAGSDHCPVWVSLRGNVIHTSIGADSNALWLTAPRGARPSQEAIAAAKALRCPVPSADGHSTGHIVSDTAAFQYTDTFARDFDMGWRTPMLSQPLVEPPPSCAAVLLAAAPVQSRIKHFFGKAPAAQSAAPITDTSSTAHGPSRGRPSVRKRAREASLKNFFTAAGDGSKRKCGQHKQQEALIDLTGEAVDEQQGQQRTVTGTVAVRQWASLLRGPLPPPLCSHGERTVQRSVVKSGPSLGRKFYVCARPEGAKGDAGARCNFFMWHSEHQRQHSLE